MAKAVETLGRVKRTAGQVAKVARERAFQAGTTYTYVEDGKILQASKDGTVVEVTNTKARNVPVSKRRWVLGE